MRKVRRDILASLAIALWIGAWIAPIHHRVEHARQNQVRSLLAHIGHVHGGVEAIDAIPTSIPHDIACVLCATSVATEAKAQVSGVQYADVAGIRLTSVANCTSHCIDVYQIRGPPTT